MKTKQVLDECLIEPVEITRNRESFVIGSASLVTKKRVSSKDNPLCVHFQLKGSCLVKGCKFGR